MFGSLMTKTALISLAVGAGAAGLSAAGKKRGFVPLVVGGCAAGGTVWFLKKNPQYGSINL
jgi:hypothetical protein